MDNLIVLLVLGIAATYPLRALMLFERESHVGPLRSNTIFVHFKSSGHTQPASLFDHVRRLFGVYETEGIMWEVREGTEQAERFTCPFCLSWWIALPFSVGYTIWTKPSDSVESLSTWIVAHLATAIIAQVVYRYLWD